MIVVVDAYNVLKQISRSAHVTDRERKKFIDQLIGYAFIKKLQLLVVFDGGIYGWQTEEKHKGVQVVYAGGHQSADDYIKRYITEYHTKQVVLVSSDNALCAYGNTYQIPSIGATDFYYRVQEVTAQKSPSGHNQKSAPLVKTSTSDNIELEQLMQEGSKKIPLKDELSNEDISQQPNSKPLTKKERMLLHKLKKL